MCAGPASKVRAEQGNQSSRQQGSSAIDKKTVAASQLQRAPATCSHGIVVLLLKM